MWRAGRRDRLWWLLRLFRMRPTEDRKLPTNDVLFMMLMLMMALSHPFPLPFLILMYSRGRSGRRRRLGSKRLSRLPLERMANFIRRRRMRNRRRRSGIRWRRVRRNIKARSGRTGSPVPVARDRGRTARSRDKVDWAAPLREVRVEEELRTEVACRRCVRCAFGVRNEAAL